MIRLVNDENCLSEITIRRIENKIQEIARLLEKNPVFFNLAKEVNTCRIYNSKLWEETTTIMLRSHGRVPWSTVISHYDDGRIYYNTKKYKVMTLAELVSNIVHEVGHHFGFSHDFKWTKTRKYSSPYYVGYLFGFLARYYDEFQDDLEGHVATLYNEWRIYINETVK